MVRCLIVDDEPLAQKVMERYILQTPALQLVGKCNNAVDAFEMLHKAVVDVMFLDIKMPGVNGIDFLKSLRQPPAVIFTTAYPEYGAMSYDVEAVDYITKPVTYERFCKSIDRLLKKTSTSPAPANPSHIYIKEDGRLVKILYNDIFYIQAMKDYLKIVTANKAYVTHMTMKAVLDLLPGDVFLRTHRSYIVSMLHVTSAGGSEIVVADKSLPLSESYRKEVMDCLGKK